MSARIVLFLLFSSIYMCFSNESVFDNISWSLDKKSKEYHLYTSQNDNGYFYKAEAIVDIIPPKLIFSLLMNYDEYVKIFPKTLIFKSVDTAKLGDIVYSKMNFFPLKNRDYYIFLSTRELPNNEFWIEWVPYEKKFPIKDDVIRVSTVNGRWKIRQISNEKLYISLEYFNDWEYSNISAELASGFEKEITLGNLKTLLKYARKKEKL